MVLHCASFFIFYTLFNEIERSVEMFNKYFGKKEKNNEIKKVGENIRMINKEYKEMNINFITSTEQMLAKMR